MSCLSFLILVLLISTFAYDFTKFKEKANGYESLSFNTFFGNLYYYYKIRIYTIEMFIYHIKTGTKNIVKWLPIIWGDVDWNYFSIYSILFFKLNNMEKSFMYEDSGLENEKYVKQIRLAKKLCFRISEDEYLWKLYDSIEERYGKMKVTYGESNSKFKRISFEESEEASNAKKRAYEYANSRRKRDMEILCKILQKYSLEWLD
jgi:hypothetical protein